MKSRLSIAALLLSLLFGASCRGCRPVTSSPIVETYYRFELGNRENFLNGRGINIFLGHRVERFRLKVRFVNPGRSAQWIPGVNLSFVSNNSGFQQFSSLPAGADPDGSFWTQEFTTNWTEIRIGSGGGVIGFDGGRPRFEIVAIERHFRSGSDRDDVPSTVANDPTVTDDRTFQRLGRNEVLGFSPNVSEAQHYFINSGTAPRLESLYISPRLLSTNNSTGLKIHISNTGFVHPEANVTWIEPEQGDTGIYTEFINTPGQDTFITVVNTVLTPYLIQHAWLSQLFQNIDMERDENMDAAPAVDVAGIRNAVSHDNPFHVQLADFIRENGTFDRRINEALTIASAFALDASNGQFRYRSANLHRDIDFFRNVDVQFSICNDPNDPDCRANASGTRISMFTLDLNDPVGAGWTFHHEWGHWDYGLPDEYLDINGPPPSSLSSDAIDANTVMATSDATEFCTPQNHFWAEDAGGEEESCWTQIDDQYAVDASVITFGDLSYSRYLDVLHSLQRKITLNIF